MAKLEIVGTNPTPAVAAATARSGASLHRDVEDVRPFYWRAAAAVAPIRLGSGLRNKVVHAIACGAPVVATSTALEGLDVDERHVLVADDPHGFAAAIVATIRDAETAQVRAEAARTILTAHRAETVGASFADWWRVAARESDRRRPARVVDDLPATVVDEKTSATVIVCTRNRPAQLRESLPAVALAVSRVPASELLIVEQGDRVVEDICAELDIKATVVHDDAVGAARARNHASRVARGDVLLFTDDDCDAGPSWVSDHLNAMHDQRLTASFGAVDGLTRLAAPGVVDPTRRRRRHRRGTAPWLVGHSANMAVTRDAFAAVGGFDERLGPGAPGRLIGEDADLIFRLLRRGAVVASGVGDAVQHLGWRSAGENTSNLVAYERGAGAWIGKALRENRRVAVPHFRERVALLWARVAHHPGLLASPVTIIRSIGAFGVGLVRGLTMSAWPER
jgi:GT2 family glycosyltransferase